MKRFTALALGQQAIFPGPSQARWAAWIAVISLIAKFYYVHFNVGLGDTSHREILLSLTLFTLGCVFAVRLLAPRLPPVVIVGLLALIALLLEADLLYYRFSGNLPSVAHLELVSNLGAVRLSVLSLFHLADWLLFIDLPLQAKLAARAPRRRPRRQSALGLVACAVALLLFQGSDPPFAFAFHKSPLPDATMKYGVLHYQLSEALHDALAETRPPTPEQEQQLAQALHRQPKDVNAFTGRYKGYNLIVIQVESLQGFVLGRTVMGRAITPNMNHLAKQSLYFKNFYHATGAGHTADAEFTTQNALYGTPRGVAYLDLKNQHLLALPKVLKDAGYATFSMHGNSGGFYNRATVHPKLGFQQTFFLDSLEQDDMLGWGVSDKSLLRQASAKLKTLPKPFYSFLVTLSSHHPYDAPYSAQQPLLLGTLENTLLGRYLSAIHYTDEAIGSFMEDLAHAGLLENTVVAIYGDHNGIPRDDFASLLQWLGKPERPYSWALAQRVPLLIHLPGQAGRTVKRVGSQVDLAPTLANLLAIDTPIFQAAGEDLLSSDEGTAVFRDGTWISQDLVWLPNAGAGKAQAFNYRKHTPIDLSPEDPLIARARQRLVTSDAIVLGDLPAILNARLFEIRLP